jgi:hypothetical protein
MNSPSHPDSVLQYASSDREAAGGYSPSVPMSVYRELAAELKATKALVESVTNQNQQLIQQNQVLRQEMLRFAEAADQMRQAIEPAAALAITAPVDLSSFQLEPQALERPERTERSPGRRAERPEESSAGPNPGRSAKVKPAASAKRSAAPKPVLFSEQRPERLRQAGSASSAQEMSGLWLATTILLIVVSAFGAGFLIMKPLLGGGK